MSELTLAPALSTEEKDWLHERESVIARGMKTFVEVGNALLEIRDDPRKVYREYGTFTDYCYKRWQLSQSRAYEIMDAATVVNNLKSSEISELLPANDAQARPLASLPPEDQVAAWAEVLVIAKTEGMSAQTVKNVVLQRATGEKKKKELQELKDSYEKLAKSEPQAPVTVYKRDAATFLTSIEPQSVDLILTDPPYSTDIEDIEKFAHCWLPLALSRLKPTGRAYVCTGAYPDELIAYLTAPRAGIELAQILVWTYRNTLGPSPEFDYKLNWQAILYFRGKDVPKLDCPVMEEQFSVQDISAPDGRQANRFHEWQKPDALGERLIRHSTAEGATVIDPFAGTGAFLAAASRLNRLGQGSEIADSMLELCEKRGIEIRL